MLLARKRSDNGLFFCSVFCFRDREIWHFVFPFALLRHMTYLAWKMNKRLFLSRRSSLTPFSTANLVMFRCSFQNHKMHCVLDSSEDKTRHSDRFLQIIIYLIRFLNVKSFYKIFKDQDFKTTYCNAGFYLPSS